MPICPSDQAELAYISMPMELGLLLADNGCHAKCQDCGHFLGDMAQKRDDFFNYFVSVNGLTLWLLTSVWEGGRSC
jgi:hypothetical protein